MEVITSSRALKSKFDQLKKIKIFTIDTEFVREKTYYASLGLIQIGYDGGEFAIDPVGTDMNLEPLRKVLADEKIVKVLHACGQDIEIFYNLFAEIPTNVFDTQIAAKLLGFGESISYGKLVEHYCDEILDKSQRFTDWMKRPLDDEQVEYAINDVTYLRNIYYQMMEELKKKDRLRWTLEEMEKVMDEDIYKIEPDECWKRMKIKSFNNDYLALVKSLCRWREFTAQNQNKPRVWILKDDAIQEIAALKPKKPNDLKGLRFFRYDAKLASEIVGVVDYGLTEEVAPKAKKKKRVPREAEAMVTILKIILKDQAQKHDIAASVIADKDDIEKIAIGDIEETRVARGWRHDIFGRYADKLLKGELAITVDKGRMILIEPDYQE